ncbi:unnamed protein product [Caenorhabditis angaria]|uniref:Receptor ligand binding region domain-containing protein n=1 Tax=Caenorhabditis angaria TaxID=860376 RepID=A0A9P1N0S6_9PELO|nr:unnamed protein product [Caenorhabditis angaria]
MFFPIFLLIFGFSCAQNTTKIRIGIAAAQLTQPESIGWSFCGGAVTMAIQRLHQMGIATGFDFETFVEYTECDRNATVAIGLDFLKNKNVDVIIGPPCVEGLKVMGTLTQLYQKPVLGWGFVSDSIFSDKSRFPLTVSMLPTSSSLGYATVKVLEHFGWDKVAILYVTSALNYCASVMDDVESVLNDPSSFSPQIVLKQYLEPKNNESYTSTLQTVMGRARIILFCAQTATEKRDYMLRIAKLGMNTNEYVHIMLSMRSVGFGAQTNNGKMTFTLSGLTPLWETLSGPSDGQESLAKSAAEKFLVIDLNSEVSDVAALTNLQKNIIASVRMPPVNCGTPQCLAANGTVMGAYARHLYDAIWLYGVAIDGMSAEGWRNVTEVLARIRKANFAGMTGQVRFNENATRMPIYQLYGLSDKWDEVALMNLNFDNGSSTLIKLYTNESAIWSTHWAGSAPLATPICGYAGTACPQTTLEKYGVLFVILAIVILFTCLVFVCCGCALIRGKRAEAERVRSEWVIAFEKLRELERSGRKSRSRRSLDSAPGSQDTRSAGDLEDQDESEEYRSLEKEIVRVKKYHPGPLDTQRFVKLRKLDHENVNKFIGLVLNGPGPYFAAFLAIGGARVHGSLRSGNCLVNDSWQVKLSDYGLDFLNEEEAPPKRCGSRFWDQARD